MKAGDDDVDEQRGEKHAGEHEKRGDKHQNGKDGAGGAGGLVVALLGIEPGVDGDEGCRENAFAEEVLQHVGDAEGGLEGIGGHGVAEIMREDTLADKADELGEQDAGGDGKGGGAAVRLLRPGLRYCGQVRRVGWGCGVRHACSH